MSSEVIANQLKTSLQPRLADRTSMLLSQWFDRNLLTLIKSYLSFGDRFMTSLYNRVFSDDLIADPWCTLMHDDDACPVFLFEILNFEISLVIRSFASSTRYPPTFQFPNCFPACPCRYRILMEKMEYFVDSLLIV
jgi:hypothetical protein